MNESYETLCDKIFDYLVDNEDRSILTDEYLSKYPHTNITALNNAFLNLPSKMENVNHVFKYNQ